MSAVELVLSLPLGFLHTLLLMWLAGYAAHCFLVVVEETARGKDRVRVYWPNDNFCLRLWKAAYLGLLAVVWLVPVGLLLTVVDFGLRGAERAAVSLVILAAVLWVFYPVTLLAVLAAGGQEDYLRLPVVMRFLRRPRIWLAFYAASAPLLIGGFVVVYFALIGWHQLLDEAVASPYGWLPAAVQAWSWLFVLPVTAALGAAALLIYARLIGRLAWLLQSADDGEPDEDETPVVPPPPAADILITHDAMEPVAADGEAGAAVETYGFLDDPVDVLPVEPVAVQPVSVTVAPPVLMETRLPALKPVEVVPPAPVLAEEPALTPSGPRRLLVRGIYRFPWYRSSLLAWGSLTVAGLILGVLIRLGLLLWI